MLLVFHFLCALDLATHGHPFRGLLPNVNTLLARCDEITVQGNMAAGCTQLFEQPLTPE